MLNLGPGEIIFILVAALLILGPQRLPELARGIGKFLAEFRRQTADVRHAVEREFYRMDQDFQREELPAATQAPAEIASGAEPTAHPDDEDSSGALTQSLELPPGTLEETPSHAEPLPGVIPRSANKPS